MVVVLVAVLSRVTVRVRLSARTEDVGAAPAVKVNTWPSASVTTALPVAGAVSTVVE
jgi:hypothetical protein